MASKSNEVVLSTKRKVKINDMSIDDIDFCQDLTVINFENGEATGVRNMSKARTAWLRRGIKGGDFKQFKVEDGLVVDSVLKQLSEDEKNELLPKIQEFQNMGEESPSH